MPLFPCCDGFAPDLPDLSGSASGVFVVDVLVLKSNAVPGVLGVLAAEPKDANAPEPRPKADAAPGEETLAAEVFRAGTPPKALARPGVVGSLELKRFDVENPLEWLSLLW